MKADSKTKGIAIVSAIYAAQIVISDCLDNYPSEIECGKPDCPDCMPWRQMREALKMVNDAIEFIEDISNGDQ